MKIWKDYYKVLAVIDSCKTVDQLNSASKMLILWLEMHLDRQVYSSTFINHIEKKFKELNGKEFDKIPYKEVTSY